MLVKQFHILYVDDDENDIQLAKFAAGDAGLSAQLHTVSSGAQAIDYVQGRGEYADRDKHPEANVMLLDLRMPRMNGFELLTWLRAQPQFLGLVVIMFTASAHPADVRQACKLGCNAFVQKPSQQTQLVLFLKMIYEFWGRFHVFPQPDHSAIEGDSPRLPLVP
jgi:CheY-like chemotaxis protein